MPPEVNHIVEMLPISEPFVSPRRLVRMRERAFRFNLGDNNSPFGISPKAANAILNESKSVQVYNDPEAYDLRSELSAKWRCSLSNVLVGSGIDDLLHLICRTCLTPGDSAVSSEGTYPTFGYFVRACGGVSATVRYQQGRIDIDALLEAVRAKTAKLLFLANPDNPTGTFIDSSEICRLRSSLPDYCFLLLDEAYADYVLPERMPEVDSEDLNVIRFRTFSKAHGLAGLRIGYAVGSSWIIQRMSRIRVQFGTNSIAQAAALASFNDEAFIAGVVKEVAAGREEYYALAIRLGIMSLPSETNFVSFDLKTKATCDIVYKSLIERDIFIRRPVSPFLGSLIRVTIGTQEGRDYFAGSLAAILNSLDSTHNESAAI